MKKHQLNLKVLREWMAEGMTPDRQTIAALDYSMALMLCVERKRTCKASEADKLTTDCPLLGQDDCVMARIDPLIEANR